MNDYILEIAFDDRDGALDELVQARLFLSGSTGSTSDDNGIQAYFDSPSAREEAAAALRGLAGIELREFERERVDWLDLYQQSLEPLFIGEDFVVSPDAALIPAGTTRKQLIVPQEQAFGTGSHETTSLCIELLEGIALQGKTGLDVGSGSGILAMAMLRLGAARALAFDNDPDTFGALRDNRVRNGIAERQMPLFIGPLEALRGGRFDVVTMNILPDVVMLMLPQVSRHLAQGARLIVSGILIERAEEVAASAARQKLFVARERTKGEWWAGELTREL